MARNGVIGRDNALPWRLPDDLKHFKTVTMGKPVLMGRKTFESIGKPLPGRLNLVLTRDPAWRSSGVVVVHSEDEAFDRAGDVPEVAVIGGAEIFRQLLPRVGRIYLTRVEGDIPGDTVFPQIDSAKWTELDCRTSPADERNEYGMTFVTLQRVAEGVAQAP
jgi:dihydrofolate reductase